MNRIRALRNERGIKQVDLARSISVSQAALSGYETGRYEPDFDTLRKIASFFDVTVDYVLGGPTAPLRSTGGIPVPVLGTVVAGIPIEAVEDILDFEEISPELATTGDFFALQVKGSSMEPRIREGDVVIVRKQSDADTGDTVVVLVNGDEATIKKLKKGDKGITLIPNNPAYEPLYYSCDEIKALPVAIVGKVIELRAKF